MMHISTRQASQMCHRLGTALRAGVDMRAALARESGLGSPAFGRQMGRVADHVARGATLAEALRERGTYFPPLLCELVDVGETTGNLDAVLLHLAEHYQHLLRMRRAFLLGILWPAVQLVLALGAIGLLILLLGALGTSSAVFGLAGVSGLAIYGLVVFGVFALVVLIVCGLLRGWFGPWPNALLMRTPVVGTTLQTMALARLSWTLSLTLNAGIDAHRAVRMALASTQSRYYTQHIDAADAVIARRGQFHEALRATGAFREEFLTAVENAEISGTETESLAHLSRDYQQRAEAATMALSVAASVAIWILIGALLVFMIFYLFFNLYMKPQRELLEILSPGRTRI